jgi:hypothetical protein
MRLTNEIKDKLTQNLLEASPLFTKARNVVAARQKLVEDIRQALLKQYDLTDEKIDEIKSSIKENGFTHVDTIKKSALRVSVQGEARDLALNGLDERHRRDNKYIGSHTLESDGLLGAKITEPVDKQYVGVDNRYLPLEQADRFYDWLIKSDHAIDSLYEEVYAFRPQVKAALSQVTTVNKLKEVWPDAVPYLPELVKQQSTAVALPVETLNAICGLPK